MWRRMWGCLSQRMSAVTERGAHCLNLLGYLFLCSQKGALKA